MDLNELKHTLKSYDYYKQAIENIDLSIREIELEICGTPGMSSEEKTSRSNRFSSVTEDQAIQLLTRKNDLISLLKKKELTLNKLDNAISSLNDKEKHIIRLFYMQDKAWKEIAIDMDYTESCCRHTRDKALNKMLKVLNNEI